MVQVRDNKDRLIGNIPNSLFNEVEQQDVLVFSGKSYKIVYKKWNMVHKGEGESARIMTRVVGVVNDEG